jgi:DNA-binding transcriptional ArsR family regulator
VRTEFSAGCIVWRVSIEVSTGPTIAVDAEALGRVGKALADPTRRRLLLALVQGPAFPSDLAEDLGLTRANVSNHLTCLRGCGLVSTVPVGRRVRYELADPRLAGALAQLASLVLVVTAGTAGEPCGPEDYDCDKDTVLAEAVAEEVPVGVSGG